MNFSIKSISILRKSYICKWQITSYVTSLPPPHILYIRNHNRIFVFCFVCLFFLLVTKRLQPSLPIRGNKGTVETEALIRYIVVKSRELNIIFTGVLFFEK